MMGWGGLWTMWTAETTRLPTLPTAPTTTAVALFSINKWPYFRVVSLDN